MLCFELALTAGCQGCQPLWQASWSSQQAAGAQREAQLGAPDASAPSGRISRAVRPDWPLRYCPAAGRHQRCVQSRLAGCSEGIAALKPG